MRCMYHCSTASPWYVPSHTYAGCFEGVGDRIEGTEEITITATMAVDKRGCDKGFRSRQSHNEKGSKKRHREAKESKRE